VKSGVATYSAQDVAVNLATLFLIFDAYATSESH
jgi:hypothetical protein